MLRPIPLRNPPNPFDRTLVEYFDGATPDAPLKLYEDATKTVLTSNDSPDVGFRYSLNPYRGCLHGCAYCYARPSHEYLGFGAGTDFERRILIKTRAPELLRRELDAPRWKGERVVLSGNTDPYQPLEASYRLTRQCLEVFSEYRNPVHVITKSPLVERDLELLSTMSSIARVGVSVSIPFWDESIARSMEPYVATPRRRIETIRRLHAAGIATTVNVAPVVPALGDRDMVRVLEAAAAAGAESAAMIMLRLPRAVRPVFEERLRSELPLAAERVLARTREVRRGKSNDPRFFSRMTGEGPYADSVIALFTATATRLGLRTSAREADESAPPTFRRPSDRGGQLRLFG